LSELRFTGTHRWQLTDNARRIVTALLRRTLNRFAALPLEAIISGCNWITDITRPADFATHAREILQSLTLRQAVHAWEVALAIDVTQRSAVAVAA
jgi:hypothetical protein